MRASRPTPAPLLSTLLLSALLLAACGTTAPATATATGGGDPGAGTATLVPAPDLPPCGDDDGCREQRVSDEGFGPLVLGATEAEALAFLGMPTRCSDGVLEGATGLYVTTCAWPSRGVELDLAADAPRAPRSVNGITVQAPFAETTLRGVGIGTSEADVRRAYAHALAPDGDADGLVAGSVYGGLLFRLERGRVASIFVGAMAE